MSRYRWAVVAAIRVRVRVRVHVAETDNLVGQR